jgi:hypothetical protein
VQVDHHLIPRPLDLYFCDVCLSIPCGNELPNLEIFMQQVTELALWGVPSASPCFHDADPEPRWSDFLTHLKSP